MLHPIALYFKVWAFLTSFPFHSPPSNSHPLVASHSLLGPYSPFLLDFVQTSSGRVNPFHISELSLCDQFRGLCEHVLCSVVGTLITFAQNEREVIAERIRDKVATPSGTASTEAPRPSSATTLNGSRRSFSSIRRKLR